MADPYGDVSDYADGAWQRSFIAFAAIRSGLPEPRVERVVKTCVAEVAVGLALVDGFLAPGRRILEVGAGIGLLAYILKRRGLDIVALEPGANGFGDSALIGAALRDFLGDHDLVVIDREASGLDPQIDGVFDLIFSVNVLEHIPDLKENIAGMRDVLAAQGVMIHTCPNYNVPYEPHYALPLVPAFPQAVTWARPELRQDELWKSLNFITSGKVHLIARAMGLDVHFRRAVLYDTLKRIESDPVFSQRHPGLFLTIYRLLDRTGLLGLLRILPPGLATPMIFSLTRSSRSAS